MNTWVIARNTFGDALRKRVLLIFLLLAFVMLTLALLLNYFTQREQSTIFKSTQLSIILIFGALISITTAVFLIPNEIERRTIYSVLAKPVQRWEFFLGKYLGGAMTVGFMVGLMSLALVLVLFVLSAKPPTNAAEVTPQVQQAVNIKDWLARGGAEFMLVLRASLTIYFQLLIVTAIATTLSLFTAPAVNFCVTAVIWLMGTFLDVFLGSSEGIIGGGKESGLTALQVVSHVLACVVPRFHDYNTMGSIIHPTAMQDFQHWSYAFGLGAYAVLFSGVILLAGVLSFDRKEV